MVELWDGRKPVCAEAILSRRLWPPLISYIALDRDCGKLWQGQGRAAVSVCSLPLPWRVFSLSADVQPKQRAPVAAAA